MKIVALEISFWESTCLHMMIIRYLDTQGFAVLVFSALGLKACVPKYKLHIAAAETLDPKTLMTNAPSIERAFGIYRFRLREP